MRIEFHGAAGGEVTGSCHLIETAGKRILFDCGMVQGGREAEARNAEPFAFDPASIDALVVSHAHIDHIGRVPLLVKRGFKGPIHAQAATCDLFPIMLLDAASLSERSAEFENRERAPHEPEAVPLYTAADVATAQRQLHPLPYETDTEILPGVTLRLHEAGHILGSAMLELRERIADRLHGLLTAQDQQAPRLHVTVQNKVSSTKAKVLQAQLAAVIEPRDFAFAGLALHRYRGGPWETVKRWPFRG